MCGVFGFALFDTTQVTAALSHRAIEALHTLDHRGPDQSGHRLFDGVFMGHTRLSVIDLSDAGRQPMVTADEQVALTVNGEIYNYRALRSDIGEASFVSACDSEVLLHGYRRYGLDGLLERIDGMYAGVIYDRRERKVVLFRDRVGIKPLYYTVTKVGDGRGIVWASELKAIRAFLDELELDRTAVLDFAAHRCIPGHKSIYADVRKLEPAQVLEVRLPAGQERCRRYWRLEPGECRAGEGAMEERLRSLIDTSVSEQLVADVPVGLFLSGGLDSSVLCEAASRHLPQINTFSIGFGVPERDETEFARLVAAACGTRHVEELVQAHDIEAPFRRMNAWFDEPFGDLSAFPTAHVSALARQHSVVALSGDGGDELFGGYKWYRRFRRYRRINGLFGLHNSIPLPFRRPPRSVVGKIANRCAMLALFDPLHLYASVTSNLLIWELDQVREWLGIEKDYDYAWSLRPHYRPELGAMRSLQYLDFHTWLPDDILTKVDRVSMAVSLEVRVPLLKKELCEFAFSLPEAFVYRGGRLKGGLIHAYRDLLPPRILERDKQGFSVPVGSWDDDILNGQPNFVHFYLQTLREKGLEAAAP